MFTYIMAVAIQALEQIMLIFWGELETIVASAVPGTAPWIQAQTLLFEYGNTVTLNSNFTIGYNTPVITDQIISACAVVVGNNGQVTIKAVTGTAPSYTTLSTPQKTALSSYLGAILPAGMNYNILSVSADTLAATATVYYNGQYTGAQAAVIAAINSYIATLPFNGIVKVSALEAAILAVPGVTDVVFSSLIAVNTFLSINTTLITGSEIINREYQTYAGYITNADPTGALLTFIVSNT
jgi:hypothetical protein